MNVLRQCIDSGNKVLNHCLKWPHVVGKYKDKLQEIEDEIVKIGQDYYMSLDMDGDVKKKVHALQDEHTKVHCARNTLIDTFWKVKDLTKGRLEQMVCNVPFSTVISSVTVGLFRIPIGYSKGKN